MLLQHAVGRIVLRHDAVAVAAARSLDQLGLAGRRRGRKVDVTQGVSTDSDERNNNKAKRVHYVSPSELPKLLAFWRSLRQLAG